VSGEERVFRNHLLVAANGLLLIEDFERLLVAILEQTAALEGCILDPARSRALGACLRRAIDRLDRVAVLIAVRAAPGPIVQRSIAAKLDALHGRAEALLAGVQKDAESETRRFATRLGATGPLASVRSGPDGSIDLSEKVVS
jgi:hypothetical protein